MGAVVIWILAVGAIAWAMHGYAAAKSRQEGEERARPRAASRRAAAQDGQGGVALATITVSGLTDDGDNWEGAFWEVATPRAVDAYLRLDYVDGTGARTQRSVKVRSFDAGSRQGLIIGHCELRNATRTFRMDRIQRAVDLDTGEVIADVYPWLLDRYRSSPAAARDTLVAEHRDTLAVLLYVAKADGRFTRPEKEVVLKLARSVTADDRLQVGDVEAALSDCGLPTLNGFRAAVRRLAQGPVALASEVQMAAEEIVATQKTRTAEEQGALDYIASKLGAARAAKTSPAPSEDQPLRW